MRLQAQIAKKKFLYMTTALVFLVSLAMVSMPAFSADGDVTFDLAYYQPGGVVPGVAPGGFVTVDVYVDASALTPELGMNAWGLNVVVNSTVLTPVAAYAGDVGYFLYDWSVATYGTQPFPPFNPVYPPIFLSSIGTDYIECTESFLPLPPEGANGTGKLCTLYFTSLSATAYSNITVQLYPKSGYQDVTGEDYAINAVDGHYNMPPNGYWFETPQGGTFPTQDPTHSDWHELEPVFCQIWTLESWFDNGDGHLSPSDQIDMFRIEPPQPGQDPYWFHVEWVNPAPIPGDGIPDMMVTWKPDAPEFPLGSVAPIALIAVVVYIWWITKRKTRAPD